MPSAHDNDGIRFAAMGNGRNRLVHLVDVITQFRYEYHVGTAGHSGIKCNPSGMMPHHFQWPSRACGNWLSSEVGRWNRWRCWPPCRIRRWCLFPRRRCRWFSERRWCSSRFRKACRLSSGSVAADADQTIEAQFVIVLITSSASRDRHWWEVCGTAFMREVLRIVPPRLRILRDFVRRTAGCLFP